LALTIAALLSLTIYGLTVVASDGSSPDPRNQDTRSPLAPESNGQFIDNGTIQLGVHSEGHLNVPGGPPSSGTGVSVVGLRYLPTGAEATAPGCLCEGWGAADATTAVTGYANESVDGIVNITPISFFTTTTTALSTVQIGSVLQVTHNYYPSPATPHLYEVEVTIENISGAPVEPRYRRVMDWDVEPTAFAEYVTIQTGTASNIIFTSDNGFETANPLGSQTAINFTGEAIDNGPADHGALFDFAFDTLNPGESLTFFTFYGAASTEAEATNALAAVGAEAFSFGQASDPYDPTIGDPNTFIFAFKGVGGSPLFPYVDLTKTVGTDPSVCAVASTIEVYEGDEVYYCYTIENTGGITLTGHTLEDSELGILLNDLSFGLPPSATLAITQPATISTDTVNVATWTAFNPGPTDVVSSTDVATVTLLPPAVELVKTVGLELGACASTDSIEANQGDEVQYCYTISNTGGISLTMHTLVDSELGTILKDFPYTLPVHAQLSVLATATIEITTTNVATWTASTAEGPGLASSTDSATVNIVPFAYYLPIVIREP
jgi:hypothetical protein